MTPDEWSASFQAAKEGLASEKKYSLPEPLEEALPSFIDHTLLKLDATDEQVVQICQEGIENKFKSICLRLKWISRASQVLKGSSVLPGCAVGFHEGTYSTEEKVNEAREAIVAGAGEIDMVMNYKKLIAKDYDAVYQDILKVREVVKSPMVLKVILETSQLSRDEMIAACVIAKEAHADFVKTSTGFNGPGASAENVQLMKRVVGEGMMVKASGGVRTAEDCIKMIEAGAQRIGTSGGVAIMEQVQKMGADSSIVSSRP